MTRILMPSIVDPAFQIGGAWTYTRGLVNLLQTAPFHAEVVSVSTVHGSRNAHRLRRYCAFAQSLISRLPAKISFQHSRRMLAAVKRHLREQDFDIILLNGTDLLWLLPSLPSGPARILCAHNIEHHLYAAQLQYEYPSSRFPKPLLLRDCARLREYELAGLRTAGNVIFVSSKDEAYARSACPDLNSLTLPPLIGGSPRCTPGGNADDIEIGMLSNFEWWPGRQGLRWFMEKVLPYLRGRVRLHLFGRHSLEVAPHHPLIVKHGYVASVDEVWSTCHFMICPVLAGSGVSIKLAEAVSRGIPVLATLYAARGLPLDPDPAIVLLDYAEDWVEFLNSAAARELRSLSPAPRNIACFQPETHVENVARFLRPLLPPDSARRLTA